MKANRYRREGTLVTKNGERYCQAISDVAAATIVDALTRAEGRIPKDEDK